MVRVYRDGDHVILRPCSVIAAVVRSRSHTFAWIAENGKHKDLPFKVLRAAEPTSSLRDRPSGAQQIERAVREWGDGDQGPPSTPGT